jgi:hypothetical protein
MQDPNTAKQFDENGVASSLKIDVVKSRLASALEAANTEAAQADAAQTEQAASALALLKALNEGTLTFAQWQALPKGVQISYKRRFGRPKLADEVRARANAVSKRVARNKVARASRRRNRAS